MTVAAVHRAEALKKVAQSLGLPESVAYLDASSNALVAQAIRRAVFVSAPCSLPALRMGVAAALAPLGTNLNEWEERVTAVIEDLLATGDILEMLRDGSEDASLVLRPAPPAFVMRKDRTFILLGVAGDEITPVHDQPVVYRPSGLRTLTPADPNACRNALLDMGLIELPQGAWLHAPVSMTADAFVEVWRAKLPAARSPGKIDNLEILDTKTPTTFYKGRWRPVTNKDAGLYLARRPRRYGANLWCLADLGDGLVERFVDVHPKDARMRDCDEAWRIQAAFDAIASAPQKVNVSSRNGKAVLAFNSPLPAWVIRRLSLIGESISTPGALLGFELPQQNIEEEVRWLETMLWLACDTRGTT
jgi:hypothetical protein